MGGADPQQLEVALQPPRRTELTLTLRDDVTFSVRLPEGRRYTVDVLDTWGMTIERLPETVEGSATIPLPARQFMALRFIAVPWALGS